MKLDFNLIPHIKINSKWIKDLNVKATTIKLLEENIGENLPDIRFGNDFLALTPKSQAAKEKEQINRTTSKLKICASKYTVKSEKAGTLLVVQWLRLHTSNAGGAGLIPGQGTRSHML